MAQKPKLTVLDLNAHLSCILCGGYFIDATTITECLHSFCRACIVRYLETSKYCPVCEVQVHKTRPLRCIRSDKVLQNIVYKLVPGLYKNEMNRRKELYASQPPEALKDSRDEEDRGEGLKRRFLYVSDEMFDLILSYRHNKTVKSGEKEESCDNGVIRRYLRCPAAVKMTHIKKFIRFKYDIPSSYLIEIQYEAGLLDDDYSLMDVAYIYSWRRAGPLQLGFRVLDRLKVEQRHQQNDKAVLSVLQEEEEHRLIKEIKMCSTEASGNADNLKNVVLGSFQSCRKPNGYSSSNMSISSSSSSKCGLRKERLVLPIEVKLLPPVRSRGIVGKPKKKLEVHNSKSFASKPKESPPLKVPKLTIPLTPKIREQAAHHAEEEGKSDFDGDLFEGRLVIVEPDLETKTDTVDIKSSRPNMADDYEIDSGRGSEGGGSPSGDDVSSPGCSFAALSPNSSVLRSSVAEKIPKFSASSPPLQASLTTTNNGDKTIVIKPSNTKDDFGALDLSTCHRKRSHDRIVHPRSKPVANPAVLDKHHRMAPCPSSPKYPSLKLLSHPTSATSSSCKKSDHSRGSFRYNRGSTLTVINPDPNSCRPKIVIKNLDPKPRHHHHHHRM